MGSDKTTNPLKQARRREKRRASFFVGNNQPKLISRFGSAVRAKRKQLGMTQAELARKAGLNRSYLSEMERGLANISLEKAESLAKALDCKLQDLLN